jgi:undecaprenyl-diphosphatase
MDVTLFEMINNLAGKFPALDALMLFSAKYLLVLFAITLAIFYLTFQANQQRMAFLAGVSTLIALGIAQIIAFLDSRPRPYVNHVAHLLVAQTKDPSFPSDHATFCFAIATMIWLYNRKVGGILLALAVLVGLSRVYVGTHYPTDILGGAALGIGISILISYAAKQNSIRTLLEKLFMKLYEWHLAAKPEQMINL